MKTGNEEKGERKTRIRCKRWGREAYNVREGDKGREVEYVEKGGK